MGWRFLFRSTSNNKTLEQNNETTSPKSHGSKNLLFNQISIVYSNISHVDGRHCQVAWSHATLSMLFSFCSVSVPIPLCCHLLSLGPCGGLLARFCGVQSGCRGASGGGGWVGGLWPACSPGTHPTFIIQTRRAPVCHRPPCCTLIAPPPLFCLSPPGTPAFLSASGSHKSANPPALLTALPQSERGRKGERDIE